LIQV